MNLNPLNLFKLNKSKVKNETNFIGRTSIGLSNPGKFMGLDLHSDTYASAYPSIRAISNEYMTVLPKAIDGNGKPVKSNILDALYHPNQLDSVVSFNEKIAVSTLVLPKTYILVWRNERGEARPGGDFGFKGKNIAGFTFLENPGISRRDGKTYYNVGSQWFTEDEVIVLNGGVDPHNLYGGYSPTEAACRWITLDDYIADFQKGFFENNAIPAGMFVITAATTTEFEDIVANLKRRHKGAGNNNNVTYSHAPVDPATGKPAQPKIEWIPFQQSNKDIDFKSLFEQANHRIDQAYGVPAIVKGIDDAATYANAQVAEAGFAKRAVLPLLTRNYAQLTHELNRITGGMGIAITFDYEIPSIADEEKVVAETHVIHANLLNSLEQNGYSLDSIVDAFDLPKRIKLLKKGEQAAVIDNDKPQVDEGGEVESSPDPEKIDGVTPLNKVERELHCSACDRFLGTTTQESYQDKLKCSNSKCKVLDVPTVKTVKTVKEAAKSTNPKAQLTPSDEELYITQLESVTRDFMQAEVDRAIAAVDSTQSATEQELEEFLDEAMRVIVSVLVVSGAIQYSEGIALLISSGLSADGTSYFQLSDTQIDRYRKYLKNVGESYSSDTQASIQAVLDRANVDGWTAQELKSELRNIMDTDEYRVKRLARSEVNRSQQMGNIYSMEQITEETGIEFRKVWNISRDDACEYCRAMNGKAVPNTETFVPVGGEIEGADGGELVNDFVSMEVAQAHPNCGCFLTYEVV
jgi:phage portal protein BeeE